LKEFSSPNNPDADYKKLFEGILDFFRDINREQGR
jgi:hypothetical protein